MEEISMYRVNVNERCEQEEERDLDVTEWKEVKEKCAHVLAKSRCYWSLRKKK